MTIESNRQKVLIVDDVTKNIQLVANFLKQAGYDINFAISGKTALNHINKEKFDLILLDIMMPEMDGFEVCQKLKSDEETKDIPIVFLTAKTDIDSITKAFQVGGIDYITKPFNRAELLARVKTHLELQEQKRNLKELNATKDKFFSIIAHDLKSPLNQLLGLSEILQKELETQQNNEIKNLVNLMNKSAMSGRMLLDNLLEWSRSQTGTINYQPKQIDLGQITDEVMKLNENNTLQKQIMLESKIALGISGYADENMIKTVLRNLISNGIKFTMPGGKIELEAKQEKDQIIYSVADNGIGMKPADLKKLFRIDINPNSIGNSKEKGTGLGLILCKEFIEINKGEIWAESKVGEGSCFKFSMPATAIS
ncbi:MAG: hybrid sensor histidine kinase/response regulator [Cyclobacteriaceae bacterium]|nr:hybrid sensor histidine kinase/response regulator [Cyclobacteriaceae bacterium]